MTCIEHISRTVWILLTSNCSSVVGLACSNFPVSWLLSFIHFLFPTHFPMLELNEADEPAAEAELPIAGLILLGNSAGPSGPKTVKKNAVRMNFTWFCNHLYNSLHIFTRSIWILLVHKQQPQRL